MLKCILITQTVYSVTWQWVHSAVHTVHPPWQSDTYLRMNTTLVIMLEMQTRQALLVYQLHFPATGYFAGLGKENVIFRKLEDE